MVGFAAIMLEWTDKAARLLKHLSGIQEKSQVRIRGLFSILASCFATSALCTERHSGMERVCGIQSSTITTYI